MIQKTKRILIKALIVLLALCCVIDRKSVV